MDIKKYSGVIRNPQGYQQIFDYQQYEIKACKSPPHTKEKTTTKKRTNTLIQIKKNQLYKKSLSGQRFKNMKSAKSARKMQEQSSQQQEKDQDFLVNMSSRNNKSASKGGLGKRSKSTIIKGNNTNIIMKTIKKQKNKNSSNPTSQSVKNKTTHKKSSKNFQVSRQSKVLKQKNPKKQPYFGNKQIFKKQKLHLKIENIQNKQGKKSTRNNVSNKKKVQNNPKNSKPTSARQKKIKKHRFIQQLKEKYENQTILQGQLRKSNIKSENQIDNQFLSIMDNLQKVLTSVGSKQKLKKQLDLINRKLLQFKIQQQQQNQKEQKQFKYSDEIIQIKRQQRQFDDKISPQCQSNQEIQPLFQRKNPLVGKRQHDFFFAQQNDQNEQQIQTKKKQIQQLKKFKLQSTKIMQKKGLANKKQIQIKNNEESVAPRQRQPIIITNQSIVSNSSQNTHRSQDKYPISMKSPKFDPHQIINAISLKQQFSQSKHNKMSELVKKMFEKQLVSPKSYEFKLQILNKNHQQQTLQIQYFKRQAEHLSSMISQIKKDKQQIQDIDELIRNQKWQQAHKLIQKQSPSRQKNDKPKINQWQKQQGWQRVMVNKHEKQDNQFIQVPQKSIRKRHNANFKINIDQQCGGTQQSVDLRDLSQDQHIYYNQQNDEDVDKQQCLLKLVQVQTGSFQSQKQQKNQVFKIIDEDHNISSQKNDSPSTSNLLVDDRKGFTTNLYFIKQYCIAICEFVRDNPIFKQQLKNNIAKSSAYNQSKLFKLMRDGSKCFYLQKQKTPSITQQIWNSFNSQYQSLKYNAYIDEDKKYNQKAMFQKQQQLIFVRMIFQVLNQSLQMQKPGGQNGKPLLFKENSKHLKHLTSVLKLQNDNLQAFDLMFGVAIARIIQWGSCLCGFLPDTIQLQNTDIDQTYVNHIRQTRMAFLLQKMMNEEQSRLSNYQIQQLQIEYNLSNLIYEQLVNEVIRQINFIYK